ncbi:MAG TPA: Uma2 family endonuclease [Isosphaeraceae bacterium]|nr:Uma2 family endonuclease [Isosphaeraceae bacterium]
MSTITPIEPMVQAPDLGWVPSPQSLYRLSIEQYERMVASGVFTKRDRLHLINGFLVAKMTEDPLHSAVSEAIRLAIQPLLPVGWHVRPDKPLRIPNYASVPEPDLVIARGSCWDYQERHPEPANVALVVEVASSSLSEDRGMADIYGTGGVPVYWIVNLVDRQVEVHTDPGPGGYGTRQILKPGQEVSVVVDGVERGRIAVVDIMPRRP